MSPHSHIDVLASTPPSPVSSSPNTQSQLWFTTSPLHDLSSYDAFQIETQSTYAVTAEEAICWFEIILANEKGLRSYPPPRGGKFMTWFSHANDIFLSGPGTKQFGMVFNLQHEIFKHFRPGDVIGVQISAHFTGWHLKSIQGRLTAKPIPDPPRGLPLNPWSLDFVPEGGIYTVASLSESILHGVEENVSKQIWFTTQPFDSRTVQRIEGVQLFTTARYDTKGNKEQYKELPCSFEIMIFDSPTATEPKAEGIRESHVIDADAHEFVNSKGPYLVKGFGALSTLMAGGVIGVALCAPKGSTNHARDGRLVIQFSSLTPTIETIIKTPSACIDSDSDTMIWFQSPPLANPFDYSAFQFVTHAENPANRKESRCKFYLAILNLKNDGSYEQVFRDNKELAWLSHAHEEVAQCQFGLKQFGTVFDHQHEVFSYLQPGDIIAMQIRSTAQTWHIRSIEGKLLGKLRTGGEDYSADLLPSWNLDPILEDGLYTVVHTIPKVIRAEENHEVYSEWFRSPVLDRKIIYHVERLRLYATAFEEVINTGGFNADAHSAIATHRDGNRFNIYTGYKHSSSVNYSHSEHYSMTYERTQDGTTYQLESYSGQQPSAFASSQNIFEPQLIESASNASSTSTKEREHCTIQLSLLESQHAADSGLAWAGHVLKEESSEGDEIFDSDSELISSLKPGNLVSVRLAAVTGCSAHASHGRLVMRIQGLCCSTAKEVSGSKAQPLSLRPRKDLIPTLDTTDDTGSSHVLAAILTPDIPDAPKLYSKYIIQAQYRSSPDMPPLTIALLVNTDVAVPRFKSKGATALYALRVEFERVSDVTGFTQFWGSIGKGEIHLTTRQKVVIHGPIEGGPEESLAFVGGGTWLMS